MIAYIKTPIWVGPQAMINEVLFVTLSSSCVSLSRAVWWWWTAWQSWIMSVSWKKVSHPPLLEVREIGCGNFKSADAGICKPLDSQCPSYARFVQSDARISAHGAIGKEQFSRLKKYNISSHSTTSLVLAHSWLGFFQDEFRRWDGREYRRNQAADYWSHSRCGISQRWLHDLVFRHCLAICTILCKQWQDQSVWCLINIWSCTRDKSVPGQIYRHLYPVVGP